MNTSLRRHPRIGLCIAALMICAASAHAQPGDRPGPPDRQRAHPRHDGAPLPPDAAPETPDQLRDRIQRRLELIRGEEARLERALTELEEGAPPERVYAELRERGHRGEDGPPHRRNADRRGGTDMDIPQEFSPEWTPRIMKFLEERNPEMFHRLTEARRKNPEKFDDLLRDRWPRLAEMMRKDRDDQGDRGGRGDGPGRFDEMRKMEREVRDLARRAAAAEGAEREALTAELRTSIDRQFELHAEKARADIEALQARIATLIERLDHATEHRAEMIDARVADLMADKPGAPKELPKPLDPGE